MKSTTEANEENKSNRETALQNLDLMSNCGKKQCPVAGCGKKFKYSSSIVHHIKIHQGLKEHQCRFCSKKFITKGNLKDHERRHLKIKLFKCSLCGERFARKDDYNQNQKHAKTCPGLLYKTEEVPHTNLEQIRGSLK